jgi:hypothetical protein
MLVLKRVESENGVSRGNKSVEQGNDGCSYVSVEVVDGSSTPRCYEVQGSQILIAHGP